MNLKRLLCSCHKCGSYAQPHALWLTDQGHLCVTAICVNCEEKTNVLFPLSDLLAHCPPPTKAIDMAIKEEIKEITTQNPKN